MQNKYVAHYVHSSSPGRLTLSSIESHRKILELQIFGVSCEPQNFCAINLASPNGRKYFFGSNYVQRVSTATAPALFFQILSRTDIVST